MAAIISISSDEEQPDPSIRPAKKAKIDTSIICLKDCDIIIESDDEVTVNGDAKINNKVQYETDVHNLRESASKPAEGTDFISKCILNHKAIEDKLKECETASTSKLDQFNRKWKRIKPIQNETASRKKIEPKQKRTVSNSELEKLPDKSKENESKQGEAASIFGTCEKMQTFIDTCLSQIHNEKTKDLFKSKVPFCKKLIDKVGEEYIKSDTFDDFLNDHIKLSRSSSMDAVKSFNDVYQHLKSKIHSVKTGAETPGKHEVIIAKLEHALRKVQRVLVKLEEAEVNFDEEEDSSYIKMQRYRERAAKIYEKICKYKREDANANNILRQRLDFAGSAYAEFNHAINRKFRNNSVFPTYYEVEKCLQKTVRDKNMNLSDDKFKREARECFKNLGNLLQKRRKIDLLSVHSYYIDTNSDPAFENNELNSKLQNNAKEAQSKIDEICEKYVKMQELGVNPDVSSDSDDSNKPSTEEEDDG